tara:strand:- start:293 stop:514 length:222 start_codon:yes stop_codon:yes gene_type:complete
MVVFVEDHQSSKHALRTPLVAVRVTEQDLIFVVAVHLATMAQRKIGEPIYLKNLSFCLALVLSAICHGAQVDV